jgi:hypothetical protein
MCTRQRMRRMSRHMTATESSCFLRAETWNKFHRASCADFVYLMVPFKHHLPRLRRQGILLSGAFDGKVQFQFQFQIRLAGAVFTAPYIPVHARCSLSIWYVRGPYNGTLAYRLLCAHVWPINLLDQLKLTRSVTGT